MPNQRECLSVSEASKRASGGCEQDFACLSPGAGPICKVEYCVDGKVHFIARNNPNPCNYAVRFGFSYLCACPTRKELYNRHGI